ncbi:MAG: hypothetical protein AAFZ01_10730 [Pseudomonadota bacterium]
MSTQATRIVAPTTGGMVWVERVRARPRLQASYAALKGDFRPLALSGDYHNFVSGLLAAHGIAEGAHELQLSADIDSGRSWEIPVLIAHLLTQAGDGARARHDVIWATGSLDPELNPQAADFSVSRKLELAETEFASWAAEGKSVLLLAPGGMPENDDDALRAIADVHGFEVATPTTFADLTRAIGCEAATTTSEQRDSGTPNGATSSASFEGAASSPAPASLKRIAALVTTAIAGVAVAVFALTQNASGPSTGSADTNDAASGAAQPQGATSALTVVRLSADSRADCIERIMLTKPMSRTVVAMHDGGYQIKAGAGLCGLRLVNQGSRTVDVRVTGDLVTAAIQGNDALFQGLALSPNNRAELIFARKADGLGATLIVGKTRYPLAITAPQGDNQ